MSIRVSRLDQYNTCTTDWTLNLVCRTILHMRKSLLAFTVLLAILIFPLAVFGQSPAPAASPQPPKTEPAKPPAPKAEPFNPQNPPKALTPAQAKELQDAVEARNLDDIDFNQAQQTVLQRNPLAKRAYDTLQRIVNSDEDVKTAKTKEDADQKAVVDKLAALRKLQGLDASWDYNLQAGQWVQTAPAKPQGR